MDKTNRRGWRLLGGAIALVIAGSAALHSASFALQARDPGLALKIDSTNPVALVRKAHQELMTGAAGRGGGADALASAREAIREQPLNAPAFRLYGLVRVANADLDAIGAQIAMSDRLSRRDVGAQLFLIEDSVRRNDIAGALRHYDTAMRADRASRALLFPVLTSALSEPLIRQRFKPYLASPPPWMESFLRSAISTSKDPSSLAALAIESGGFPDGDEYGSIHTELMVALEAANQLPQLARYYRSIGTAPQSNLTSLAFTEANTDRALAPVSWLPYATDGIDSTFVSTGGAGLELETTMNQGFAGIIARKLTALRPGNYTLRAPMRAENFYPGDTVRWQVSCPGTGNGKILFNATAELADQFSVGGRFSVPNDCPVQKIEIFSDTSFGAGSLTLTSASPALTGM